MHSPQESPNLPPVHPLSKPSGLSGIKRRRFRKLALLIGIPVIIVAAVIGAILWYEYALSPLNSNNDNRVRLTVSTGASTPDIAASLQDKGIIRSKLGFQLYTRLSGKMDSLRAGTYAFSPSQSVQTIVADLASGKTDEFSVTIIPGQTVKDITTTLKSHGYSTTEIDAALSAPYSSSLLDQRNGQTSLEGFVYPDTYNALSDQPLQTLFQTIFDHFGTVVTDNNLEAGFKAHGLSLYQGITLASIVQKEVSNKDDQRKVASVFYNRLADNISLGSDVTFIYGASLLGVTPTPTLDSPYNLRINKGLTPTPISSPGLDALEAVANPDQTNYLFFLSGDDGKTYFATTDAEHEQNIKNYCSIKCQ